MLGSKVHQYSLNNKFVTTSGVTYDGTPVTVSSLDLNPSGIAFNAGQTSIFLVGGVTAQVYQFSVSNNIAFQEKATDNGSVDGCLLISTSGVAFASAGAALTETTDYTIDNLPNGLTPLIDVYPDGDLAALTISGQAERHKSAQDVATLTFSFTDNAFQGQVASNVSNAVAANAGLGVDFVGQSIVVNSNDSSAVDEGQTSAIDVNASIGSGTTDQGITYSIAGGADASLFDIVASTGVVTFKATPDFEAPADANKDNTYLIQVDIADGQETLNETLSIVLQNTNDNVPAFTSDTTLVVFENITIADTLRASDADGDTTLLFSITGGADSELLNLDETTGKLSFVEQPDFENPDDSDDDNVYSLIATVSDGANSSSMNLTVTVQDNTNEALPEILTDSATQYEENRTDQVLTVEAEDTDAMNTLNLQPDRW